MYFNLSSIRGGVHPAAHKDLSAALPIGSLPLPPASLSAAAPARRG
ncbi:hypothetical protein ACFS3C_26070 [Azotobacter vinelandii]